MVKNILVLTGSPRKNGNSEMMADAFIKGARAKGHIVTKFETAMKNIGGCKACNTCWSKGSACSFQDDFSELEPLLESADVIVFVTPLYWSGMSSQIKATIDRLYAYVSGNCKRPLKIRESVFMICGEGEEHNMFNGAIETYKGIINYLKWKDLGIITVPGVANKGDIASTNALKQAENLGMSISFTY